MERLRENLDAQSRGSRRHGGFGLRVVIAKIGSQIYPLEVLQTEKLPACMGHGRDSKSMSQAHMSFVRTAM